MSFKKGEIVSGRVEKLLFPNKGILYTEGGESFMAKSVLPGQEVLCRIKKSKKGKEEGTPIEITRRSFLEKNKDICPEFERCGSCIYQSVLYDDEIEIKEEQLRDLFIPVLSKEGFERIYSGFIKSPQRTEYRNKMELSFGNREKDGELTLGMHKRGSFYDIVSAEKCNIMDSDMRLITREVLSFFKEEDISFRHKKTGEGYLRHLLLRRSKNKKEILIDLITTTDCALNNGEKTDEDALLNRFKERLLLLKTEGTIKGILHTKNDSDADAVIDEGTDILFGEDFFYEEVLGLTFKITPFSFFQTNTKGCEILYEKAAELLLGDGSDNDKKNSFNDMTVYDLYSGTGTISQILAPYFKKVYGVEIVREAVLAARENAVLNGLKNITFIEGDVLKVLDEMNDTADRPDAIVLDPPRDGVNSKALKKILSYGVKNIIYISCKPTSLVRDLKYFLDAGYEPAHLLSIDMFPLTGGFEVVCSLSKQKRKPDTAAVTESQFCDFAFLTEMTVDTVLLNRNAEHLTGRGTIDIFAFREYLGTPGLTGKAGQHSGFDGGEAADDELISGTGYEGCPNQL